MLETLVIDAKHYPDDINSHDPYGSALVPEGRYAKMRNVWCVPTVDYVQNMLQNVCAPKSIDLCDVSYTSIDEQRSTDWMTFHSLSDFLNHDQSKTCEGLPPPLRALWIVQKIVE